MRGALLLLLLAGCSSEAAAPSDLGADLSAATFEACKLTFGGDLTGTEPCEIMFCQPTSDALLRLYSVTGRAEMGFTVGGQFSPSRTYGAGDLKSFYAMAANRDFTARYDAGDQIVGSTMTLTVSDVVPTAAPCPSSGTAHGTAHIGLVEMLGDDGGTRSPGHLTIDATF